MSEGKIHRIEKSAIATICGVILLFSGSVLVTLIAPSYVDPSWTQNSSAYQKQMYEVSDPNTYIGTAAASSQVRETVYHLKQDYSLLAFQQSDTVKILAAPELQKYITEIGEPQLKLTSRLLLLRKPAPSEAVAAQQEALKSSWEAQHPTWQEDGLSRPHMAVWELFAPPGPEAFALAPYENTFENWVDKDYLLVDGEKQPWHTSNGVIFIHNPIEYRLTLERFGDQEQWRYDPHGRSIATLEDLKEHKLQFHSRADLIHMGEHIYAIEGCWYCHTDQTRTLIQDVVLNGSAEFPAPPSSANEYIYQRITFPGTRRIGPDMSRVGVKRPSRDWHKGHFWAPKTASKGSIMPAFQHFFDEDPRGTAPNTMGIPNAKFEAIFQYLMTKGTRITPPTQAWWLGKDPIQTQKIIEGRLHAPY